MGKNGTFSVFVGSVIFRHQQKNVCSKRQVLAIKKANAETFSNSAHRVPSIIGPKLSRNQETYHGTFKIF